MNYFSSAQKLGKTVTQIIHFSGGNKRTIEGVITSRIKQGEFTKLTCTNGVIWSINTNNVDCFETIAEDITITKDENKVDNSLSKNK